MQKALHHDLAGQRRRNRRVQAGGQQRHREQGGGDAEAEQRRQQFKCLTGFGHFGASARMEGGGGDDQDGGVDEQRQHQGDGRIRRRPFDRLAAALVVPFI